MISGTTDLVVVSVGARTKSSIVRVGVRLFAEVRMKEMIEIKSALATGTQSVRQ